MLWRFSREELKVKLANGKVVRLSHGHELGFRMDASPEEVMKRLLENKDPNEVRVIGHYHKSLYEPEERGVMLGAWRAATPRERKMGLSPDVADILLIRRDGLTELLRGM
ncbi:MAG: hypothetical protein QW491_09110 [Thermoproteota archaeon]